MKQNEEIRKLFQENGALKVQNLDWFFKDSAKNRASEAI